MRLRLLVEVLPRETQVNRRDPAVAIGVLLRQGHAEGLGGGRVAPDDGLALVRRDARCPEMVRVQIEDRQAGAGRRIDRDRYRRAGLARPKTVGRLRGQEVAAGWNVVPGDAVRTAHRAADQRRTVEEGDPGHPVGIVRVSGERDGRRRRETLVGPRARQAHRRRTVALDGNVVRRAVGGPGGQVVSLGRGVRRVGGLRTVAGGGDGRGVGQELDVGHRRFAQCISSRLISILSPQLVARDTKLLQAPTVKNSDTFSSHRPHQDAVEEACRVSQKLDLGHRRFPQRIRHG